MSSRKGATRRRDVPREILDQLNSGELETATLAESLAMDLQKLLKNVAPELPSARLREVGPESKYLEKMVRSGKILAEEFGKEGIARFAEHPSDTVRGWACYMIAHLPVGQLKKRFQLFKPLADDAHFGVREWAWMALRPHLAKDLEQGISLLVPWTKSKSTNLRRFASEVTRPRGVWCTHLEELKTDPRMGLILLEPLRSDPTKYVQDSVANWLNDAGKSAPAWVLETCTRWLRESPTPATKKICKRALRNLDHDLVF